MNSSEGEIESCLFNGNYSQALETAKKDLASSDNSDGGDGGEKYLKAKEAYIYAKFFADRQDRISSIEAGKERAKMFMAYLKQLEDIRKKYKFQALNRFERCALHIFHSEVARSLAKEMAGQKAHNLQEADIFQLVFSLIELKDFKAARPALRFLYKMKPQNPLVNLLLAFVNYESKDAHEVDTFLREALFINPDILKEHSRFIPGEPLKKLWEELGEPPLKDEVRCRNFALLVEVNDFYQKKREVSPMELKKIEDDYQKLAQDDTHDPAIKELILPRLLHYLTWIIFYSKEHENYEKVEHYQKIMMEQESEIYNLFKKNHLL